MLAFLLLTLVTGFISATLHESTYRGRREYIYRYMVQSSSGLPGSSRSYSSFKIVTNVKLQFVTSVTVVAKLEQLELYVVNDVLRQNPFTEQLDTETMQMFFDPRIHSALSEPFTFNYIRGHVVNLQSPEYEPYWSLNIKRGILSLLEVNLNQRFNPVRTESTPSLFEAYEASASGLCRTLYTVEDPVYNSEIPKGILQFKKTKNFEDCPIRHFWWKSMLNAHHSPDSKDNKIGIRETAQVRYTLKGSRNNFVILSANGESRVNVSPFNTIHRQLSTSINQTMFLVDSRELTNSDMTSIADKNMIPRYIYMFLAEDKMDSQIPFADSLQMPISEDELRFSDKSTIINVLKLSAQGVMGEDILSTAAQYPITAISLIRLANNSVLEEIWNDYAFEKDTESEYDIAMRKMLWQVIAAAGTSTSGSIILKSCVSKKIPSVVCAGLINSVSLINQPTSTFINQLIKVTGEVDTNTQLMRSLWLGIGTIANKLIRAEQSQMKEIDNFIPTLISMINHEQDDVARKELIILQSHLVKKRATASQMYTETRVRIVGLILDQLTKQGTESKIMALKTAGNTEMPELIPVCMSFVKDQKQPEFVRFSAVQALERMARWAPVVVVKNLLPVFMSTTDLSTVRLAVITAILKSCPDKHTLELLARHVTREPDVQVSAYMSSIFTSLANTKHPHHQAMARKFGKVLQYLPRNSPGSQYSAHMHWEKFSLDNSFRGGISSGLSYYGSSSSIVPTFIRTYVDAHMMDVNIPILDFSLYTNGLHGAMSKILKTDRTIFRAFTKRHKRDTDYTNVEEIIRKLNVKTRAKPSPAIILSMKLFDYELRYFTLDDALHSLASAGTMSLSFNRNGAHVTFATDIHQPMLIGDAATVVPTEAGIPVLARFVAFTNIRVKGTIAVKIHPSLYENSHQSEVGEIAAICNLNPSAVVHVNGYLASLPFQKWVGSGFVLKTKLSIPVIGNLTVNLRDSKIFSSIAPPIKQTEPLVEFEEYPVTFQTIDDRNGVSVIEVMDGEEIVERIEELGSETFGFNVIARTKITTVNGDSLHSILPITGRSTVNVLVKSGPSTPNAIKLQVQFTGLSKLLHDDSPNCGCKVGQLTACMVPCVRQVLAKPVDLQDFPDLSSKHMDFESLRSKLQSKLGKGLQLSTTGHNWGLVIIVDSSSQALTRRLQIEAIWQSVNKKEVHQIVIRVLKQSAQPKPWQMVLYSMIQIPTHGIQPTMLFTPSYQRQLRKDLNFMSMFRDHRDLLAHLNNTVLTQVTRHMQYLSASSAGKNVLRTFALHQFANVNNKEIANLIPIWRKLTALTHWIESVWQRTLDPIFLMKNSESIRNKLVDIEQLQHFFVQALDGIKTLTSVPDIYPSLLEYLITEHYNVLVKVTEIGYRSTKISLFPSAVSLYTTSVYLINNLNEVLYHRADQLISLPPHPAPLDPAMSKIWSTLEKVSTAQMTALKRVTYMYSSQAGKTLPMQVFVDVVVAVKEVMPDIRTVMKSSETISIQFGSALYKLSVQHNLLLKFLLVFQDTFGHDSTQKESFIHVVRSLKSQTSVFAITSAVFSKFHQDLLNLNPNDFKSHSTILKELYQIQVTLVVEVHKVFGLGIYMSIRSNSLEEIEQLYVVVDDNIQTITDVISKIHGVVDTFESSNVDLNINLYENALVGVAYTRIIVKELKYFMVRSKIKSSASSRSLQIVRECESMLSQVQEVQLRITKSFQRIWKSASYTDMTNIMSEDLLKMTLSLTANAQTKSMTEIAHWKVSVDSNNKLPWIESILDTCSHLQSKIDWLQLWGVPLGQLAPLFERVIQMQQKLISRLKMEMTIVQLDHVPHLNKVLNKIQDDLTRIVNIRSFEIIDTNTDGAIQRKLSGVPTYDVPFVPDVLTIHNGGLLAKNTHIQKDSIYLPYSITMFVNVTFGSIESTPETVAIKGFACKSFQQLLWESKQMDLLSTDPSLENAISDIEGSGIYTTPENSVVKNINALNHLHFTWQHQTDLREWQIFKKLNTLYRFMGDQESTITFGTSANNTPNTVHVITEKDSTGSSADMTIITRNTTATLRGIDVTPLTYPLSGLAAVIAPTGLHDLPTLPILNAYTPASCKIVFDNIQTFDGVRYNIADAGSCPIVLAMDCSAKHEVLVTLRTEANNYARKTMEIMAEGKTITLTGTEEGVIPTIDGNTVISRTNPYFWQKIFGYGKSEEAIKIFQEQSFIIVELPRLGWTLRTDGNIIEILVSLSYKIVTCGLCSNMDGQLRGEFQAADGSVSSSPSHFMSSYIIHVQGCPAERFHKVGGAGSIRRHRKESGCVPSPMTRIKYRKRQKQICFSIQPVAHCPISCRVDSGETIKMAFYCQRIGSKKAIFIKGIIKNNRGIVDLSGRAQTCRINAIRHKTCRK